MNYNWQEPFSDSEMDYDTDKHRYILTQEYVLDQGIDLDIELNTEGAPDPSLVPQKFLDRASLLVYTHIYGKGRNKADKEYLLACDPELRPVIRDAMMERVRYMLESNDLSVQSGAYISEGTRIETRDLISSTTEEMILRPTGLLHRGDFHFIKDDTIDY